MYVNVALALRYASNIVFGSEGFSAVAYLDTVAKNHVWTIGHGTTRINGEPVREGMICTRQQADTWAGEDMKDDCAFVMSRVHVPINEFQLAALTSLCYNIGDGRFAASSVLAALNMSKYAMAANRFLEYDHAGSVEVTGLTLRRGRERAVFLIGTGVDPAMPEVRVALKSVSDQLNQNELDRIHHA